MEPQEPPPEPGPSGPLGKAISVIIAAAVAVLVTVAVGKAVWPHPSQASQATRGTQQAADYAEAMQVGVTVTLTGSASSVEVTQQVGHGAGTDQYMADVPLTRKTGGAGLEMDVQSGTWIYFSAQNQDGYGNLKCQLVGSDGTVIDQSTSSVPYGIVTCSGDAA